MDSHILRKKVRYLIIFFIAALLFSGITAFPIKHEVDILNALLGKGTFMDNIFPGLSQWIAFLHDGISATHDNYPFMFYGTDWLAFAHIVIAIAFIGPLIDPVRNIWVVKFGIISCILVIPLAMICGPLRGIPFFWRLIDCSFGVFGTIPLLIAHRYILQIQEIEKNNK